MPAYWSAGATRRPLLYRHHGPFGPTAFREGLTAERTWSSPHLIEFGDAGRHVSRSVRQGRSEALVAVDDEVLAEEGQVTAPGEAVPGEAGAGPGLGDHRD